jgi:hypothetical protein
MDDEIKNHIKEVEQWLEKNVQRFDEPKVVKLSDFEVDWTQFSGSFLLSLDNLTLQNKIKFNLDASGKTAFSLPMFHSPLGAPASYAAIEITKKTHKAITTALHKTIPKLMGAGKNSNTGEEITFHTPPHRRIALDALEHAKNNVSATYEIEISIDSV